MHIVKSYPDGIFAWVDLATPDPVGAKAFYSGLFGWEGVDMSLGDYGFYTNCQIDGYNVAGIGSMDAETLAQGIPPSWSSYVKHSDVDSIAVKVAEAGGLVIAPPMDIFEEGRMAVFQDPAGAIFGVWQPKNHIGAQLVNQPNTLVWNELQTRDLAVAKPFYETVFGWSSEEDDDGYVASAVNGRVQAGMMAIDENWPETVPSHWHVYFMVEDVEATVVKAQELGGTIVMPPHAAGDLGIFTIIQDPQGAVFAAIKFNGPADTPPG